MKVSVSLPGEDVEFLDAYARERGLESRSAALHKAVRLLRASELATAYEGAWDQLDFSLLYDLSGEELRDGLRREQFVAAKRAAYANAANPGRLGASIAVDDVVSTEQTAIVATRVSTDEGMVQNRVVLERRANGWIVVGYSIRTA